MNDQPKRILWITYVKAICMMFVFLSHCAIFYGTAMGHKQMLFEPFYVNAFFLVSGYLLFRKQLPVVEKFTGGGYKPFLKSVLCGVLLPTLLFSVLTFFPKMLFLHEGFDWGYFLSKTLLGHTYWFTGALLVVQLLTGVLLLSGRKSIGFYFVAACLLTALGIWMSNNEIGPNPWLYKQGLICAVFFVGGGAYWKYETVVGKILKKWVVAVLLMVYLAMAMIPGMPIRCTTSLCEMNLLGIVMSFVGSVLLIEFCKLLPSVKWLEYIGNNSLGFYFFSGIMPMGVATVVSRVLGVSWALLPVVWLLSFLGAYVAVMILKKWTPWVFKFDLLFKK